MARIRFYVWRVMGLSAILILSISFAGPVAVFTNVGGLNSYLLQMTLRHTFETSVDVGGPVDVSWSTTADGSAALSVSVYKVRIDDPKGMSFPALLELRHAKATVLVGAGLSGVLVFPSVLVRGLVVNLRVINKDETSLDLAKGQTSETTVADEDGIVLPVFR